MKPKPLVSYILGGCKVFILISNSTIILSKVNTYNEEISDEIQRENDSNDGIDLLVGESD